MKKPVRKKLNIVIVDDSESILQLVQCILAAAGIHEDEMHLCESASHACKLIAEGPLPDLVITDLQIPHEPLGFEVLRTAREASAFSSTPVKVIMMSGSPETFEAEQQRTGLKPDKFISKPFQNVETDLIQPVAECLRHLPGYESFGRLPQRIAA